MSAEVGFPVGGISARAAAQALHAATEAAVRVEQVHELADLRRVIDVVEQVWRTDPSSPVITVEILRALTHAGAYASLAIDSDDGRDLGCCIGFPSLSPPASVHSHIAGVVAAGAGRHIGMALKLDQRVWALQRGVETITWTYDPLIRRNAWFNAGKLGALPREYLVDFYGEMTDALNAGQGSDRLAVHWAPADPGVAAVVDGAGRTGLDAPGLIASGAVSVALDMDDDAPVPRDPGPAAAILIATPVDIERLRTTDAPAALGWRLALRDELGGRMADGWQVTGFLRDGWYLVERTPA